MAPSRADAEVLFDVRNVERVQYQISAAMSRPMAVTVEALPGRAVVRDAVDDLGPEPSEAR
jgi:hypothetical protein